VGFEGNIAVVDGNLKRRYGKLNAEGLAREGLYKQAVCAAVYDEETDSNLEKILEIYNQAGERAIDSAEELKRVFGVFEVPEGIGKVMVI
jgi:hypothetical protein